MKRQNGLTLAGIVACTALATGASAAEKVTWNLSVWGNARAVTAGIEKMRDDIAERTGGNFQINIGYGETLSPAKENIDAIKIGVIEAAQFCPSYGPGKVPAWTVLDLPFLPTPTLDAEIAVHEAFYDNEYAKKDMARWGAKPLMSTALPQYEFMGTGKPPTELEDWKGLRVRALGGIGDAMIQLGAIPTTVTAPEIYTGLERGMFQAASFPFSDSFGAFRLDEVSNWYTYNMHVGTLGCQFVMSEAAWENLPAEYQQLLMEAKPGAYEALKAAYKAGDDEYVPRFDKRGLTRIVYTPEQIEKLREIAAKPVWEAWIKEVDAKGIPGQELLDYVLEAAKKAGS